jgi:ferredoxin
MARRFHQAPFSQTNVRLIGFRTSMMVQTPAESPFCRHCHTITMPRMPKITVQSVGSFEVPQGKRLVNALEDEAKIDQLHACGGNARCTTCRVEFISGEPSQMTEAEKSVLQARALSGTAGLRLSCQILCDHDMEVRAISRLAGSGRKDAGARPADEITPPAVWTTR